jgi:N-acetylneuraminate synthase
MVEKHLTFSRSMYGSDAANAAEPAQFKDLVKGLRAIGAMTGHPVDKDDLSAFRDMKRIFEKSIVAAVDIPAGAVLTADMLAFKKPGDGIAPSRLAELVGKRAARAMPADHKLALQDVAS